MGGLVEKIATWTYFIAALAILLALLFNTLHLTLNTATSVELTALETKMDKRFDHLESILVNGKLDAKQEMITHLSTAHSITPAE
jgi:hypothetical protein